MTLEKAREIQKICNKIDEIEQNIEELNNCSYVEINMIKATEELMAEPTSIRVYKSSNIYSHILQAHKEDRNSLITELDLM